MGGVYANVFVGALPLNDLDFRSQFLDLSVLLLFGFGLLFKTGNETRQRQCDYLTSGKNSLSVQL